MFEQIIHNDNNEIKTTSIKETKWKRTTAKRKTRRKPKKDDNDDEEEEEETEKKCEWDSRSEEKRIIHFKLSE